MLNKLAGEIREWRIRKEFYTPPSILTIGERDLMLGKLMLVVTEVAESAEAVRKNNLKNFKEEIADTFIRLLDICGSMNIDIECEIKTKMAENNERPKKHGKFCSI